MQTLILIPPISCKISSSFSTKENTREFKGNNPILEKGKHEKVKFRLIKNLAPPLMAAALLTLSPILNPPVSIGETIEMQRGATLFDRACIACHVGGGNIIQPGATLFLKDLQRSSKSKLKKQSKKTKESKLIGRNGVDTEDEIYSVTYFGKGRMPGFGENCKPRGQCTFGARLQEDEIRLLAEFVKSQAAQGWPNIQISGD